MYCACHNASNFTPSEPFPLATGDFRTRQSSCTPTTGRSTFPSRSTPNIRVELPKFSFSHPTWPLKPPIPLQSLQQYQYPAHITNSPYFVNCLFSLYQDCLLDCPSARSTLSTHYCLAVDRQFILSLQLQGSKPCLLIQQLKKPSLQPLVGRLLLKTIVGVRMSLH